MIKVTELSQMRAICFIFLALQFLVVAVTSDGSTMYRNYCYLSIKINSPDQLNTVMDIVQKFPKVIVLNEESIGNGWLPMAVPNPVKAQLFKKFEEEKIEYIIVADDLGQLITQDKAPTLGRAMDGFDFQSYHPLETINAFIEELPNKYPELASLVSIGKSVEGRDITVVKLSFSESKQTRKVIFVECGIHAREWIAPASCLGLLDKLITTKPLFTRVFDFHILPVFNVDGYKFSWDKDRMWRKNRQLASNSQKSSCLGVDLNRNFDYFFGSRSSTDPCDQQYNGGKPLNQPESRALADYVTKNSDKIAIYFSVHSYSQFVIYNAVGVNKSTHAIQEHLRLARLAAAVIKKATSTNYKAGLGEELIPGKNPKDVFGGITDGYAVAKHHIPYGFCFELRDKGHFGFLLPANQIQGTTEDLYAGISAIATDRMAEFSGDNSRSGSTADDGSDNSGGYKDTTRTEGVVDEDSGNQSESGTKGVTSVDDSGDNQGEGQSENGTERHGARFTPILVLSLFASLLYK